MSKCFPVYAVSIVSICFGIVGCGKSSTSGNTSITPPPTPSTPNYLSLARATHQYTASNLLTSFGSYRSRPGSGTSYAWYVGSQIDADAAMVSVESDSTYTPKILSAYNWMGGLWDTHDSAGGYFAAANIDGTNAGGGKYVDDNSLIGVAYLDAYDATGNTSYLYSAQSIANWLMMSGMWDTTYGGGFWWSDAKTVKPTQSNGLAMQLFVRLYKITGQIYYQQWASSVKDWLESQMLGSNGLYIWEFDSTQGGAKQTINFAYDNSIMIEADLLWASVMDDSTYVAKAEAIAYAMNTVLWDHTYKAYHFTSANTNINPTWCVWASQSIIRLYQADNNKSWLTYAQQNIDFMNKNLRDSTSGAYYQWVGIDGTGRTTDFEGVDQAWMQRTLTLYAPYAN
jgi:uncharacterized protein YyaL (SSP411 family)